MSSFSESFIFKILQLKCKVCSCCFLFTSGDGLQCSVWHFMWEDPIFFQSYFNTDLQNLQTTTSDKVLLDCASVASVFSKLEHQATTLILFQNSACPGAGKKLNLSGCRYSSLVNFCSFSFGILLYCNKYKFCSNKVKEHSIQKP